ncbi:MAG TPA: CocE/NonD family hydrolase [Solirubrobacteraceae bacterium]|nr:CocE/NonD family hydrolase [Solirubrobacteraceae bacterium]
MMRLIVRLRARGTFALALAGAGASVLACAAVSVPSASAVVPPPPPGAPAVESAPPSLVGATPELPPSVIAASAARGSQWRPEKAIYGTKSINDIAIRGAGGTTIRVNEIYPTTASGRPAKGPFPVLLTMTPYGKGQGGSSSPGSAEKPSSGTATGGPNNYLAQRGYIEVVEDVRGTGDSNRSWGLFDPIQQQDAIKVLRWAAHLPHSDGRVGTYGPSYLGIDQLLLAGAVGPHSPLKAIFPMVSANDIYRDTSFMGGLLDFEFSEIYLGLTGVDNTTNPITDTASDPALLSDLAGIEADHMNGLATYHAAVTENVLTGGDEAYDGSYWQARNPQNVLARIVANHIPAYLVGGEFDIFQNGEPVNYAELQNAWDGRSVTAPMLPGQPTTGRYQLIVGPWEHLNGSSVDVDPLELEWFDTWLKHEHTGMARTPTPLHYYDLGSGQFDETTTYPFTGATPTRFYFGAGGTLSRSAPSPGPASGTAPVGLPTTPGLPTLPVSVPTSPVPLPTLPGVGSLSRARFSGSQPRLSLPTPGTWDTLAWSPSGAPCGRPIDQWSMGGISVPAGSAGFLGPCVSNDRLSQLGPWAITYTSAPFGHAETVAGPITATVYASSTTPETELVAEVEDVTPNGDSYPLTEGALLGSLRAVDKHRSWTAHGITILPYHPYTKASSAPVTPGALTQYQIQIFPTLATIAAGDRLRVTLATVDTPHLTPLPEQLPKLTGGIYTIARSAGAPSSLSVELIK